MNPSAPPRANGLPSLEIAHLVHQNEELQHLSEQLYTLNQTKNRCIGVVAHDLQTPLTNLRLLAAKLRKTAECLTPAQQRWVDEIDETARRMGDLIRHTLDLNRIEHDANAPHRTPTDLLPLLAALLGRFAHLAERKGIRLRLESDAAEAWASTDPEYVTEIVENLVSNAIKYSPPGKTVWVGVGSAADALRVAVRDEGPGIPAAERPRLFGSFVTLSPRPTAGEPSTGLGLSIAKTYADQLGAALGYEEHPGAGATFVLALPVRAEG